MGFLGRLIGFDWAWLILRICRWRAPFANAKDEEPKGKAKAPNQATVEDAEDEDFEGDEIDDEREPEAQDFDSPDLVRRQRTVSSPHENQYKANHYQMENLDKKLDADPDTSWRDVNVEGDDFITDEDKVTDPRIIEHQRRFVNYRELRAKKFPQLLQDDATVKSEFAKVKEGMKSRLAMKNMLSMGDKILTDEEAVAVLGPYSSPAQRQLLFLQRYYQLSPPMLKEDFEAFKEHLGAVDAEIQSELKRGDIKYHDPVNPLPIHRETINKD
jgi:hypothetical protein